MNIAIYSRKSKLTGKGESIENQIEMCKDYSLHKFGDDCNFLIYEDEGFSGRNTDRPMFRKMMQDMKNNKFKVLVCYRLDRISRSVSDFADILDKLQNLNIDFVSIKESFDTSTPMGRAMIHIASVFAQLERETIAERIKDNKYKLYRTGRWQGGTPPTGYVSEQISISDENGIKRSMYILLNSDSQSGIIRLIFDKFIELGSLSQLEEYLMQNGILSPGGKKFSKAVLRQILCNPVYVNNCPCVYDYLKLHGADIANYRSEYEGTKGLIGYSKTSGYGKKSVRRRNSTENWIVAISHHQGIIDADKWLAVQEKLVTNAKKMPRTGTGRTALLSGLLRCGKCGSLMQVKGNRCDKNNHTIFYYVCGLKKQSRGKDCSTKNIAGAKLDAYILNYIKNTLEKNPDVVESVLSAFKKPQNQFASEKEISKMQKLINQNEDILIKLVIKLSNASEEQTNQIYSAIKKLTERNERIEKEMAELLNTIKESRSINIPFLNAFINGYVKIIDTISAEDKRIIMQSLIKSITYDGDNVSAELYSLSEGSV